MKRVFLRNIFLKINFLHKIKVSTSKKYNPGFIYSRYGQKKHIERAISVSN